MEDYNRLCFNMSQIDEEDSQMTIDSANTPAPSTSKPGASEKPDVSFNVEDLGTPKSVSAFKLDLSATPELGGTPLSIATAKEDTPGFIETPQSIAKENTPPAINALGTPKSFSATQKVAGTPKSTAAQGTIGTPRSIACPPKKARKPLIMLDDNLEQSLLEETTIDLGDDQYDAKLKIVEKSTIQVTSQNNDDKLKAMEEIHNEQQFVLLEQIAQSEYKLEQKDAEIAELKQKYTSADSKIKELVERMKSTENHNATLLQEQILLKTAVENAEKKMIEVDEHSKSEIDRTAFMLEQKETEIAELKQKFNNADSTMKELAEKLERAENQNAVILQEEILLRAAGEKAEQKTAELEEHFKAENEKSAFVLEQKETEIAELKQKFQSADSTAKGLAEKLERAENQNAILSEEKILLRDAGEKAEQKTTELEDRHKAEIEKTAFIMEHKEAEIKELKEKFTSAESRIEEIAEKLQSAEKQNDTLFLEQISLKSAKESAEQKLAEMKERSRTESEEFDEIENNLRKENFDLKREIVQYKCKLKLISEEQACLELGCDLTKVI